MGSNSKRKGYGISMLLAIMLLAMAIGLCAFASDSDEQTIVTNGSADLKVTYLGNSLRMDYVDESACTKTCMRFGYQFTLPEGKKMSDYTWYWEYTTDGKEITNENVKTSSGTNYVAVEGGENTYNSNLVITNIPANYYERNFYVRLVVKDGESILTVDTVLDASIKGVADKIKVANENESDVTYATGIITEDEAHNTKVDDLIFKGLDKGVAYASNMSKSESEQKTVIVRDDITLSAAIDIPTGADVAIKDDGEVRTLKRDKEYCSDAVLFNVYRGGNLTFTSSEPEQVSIVEDAGERVANSEIKDMLIIDGNCGESSEVTSDSITGNCAIIKMLSDVYVNTEFADETGGSVTVDSGVAFVNNISKATGAVIHTEANAYGNIKINGGRFMGNTASGSRSGVFQVNANNSAEISNAAFASNSAKYAGVFALGTNSASSASGTEVSIDGCVFSNNTADTSSGIFTSYAQNEDDFIIKNSIFTGNAAPTQGVGQIVGVLKTENCKFTDNKATETTAGVFYFASGSVANIVECDFTRNIANTFGGVLIARGSSGNSEITIDNCTFTSNIATTNGGVFADHASSTGSTVIIQNSTFKSNEANDTTGGGGGALYFNKADNVSIIKCEFTGNKTYEDKKSCGGAINAASKGGSSITIENSTFKDGNTSRNGGAIFIGQNNSLVLKGENVFEGNAVYSGGAGKDCFVNGKAASLTLSGKLQSQFHISLTSVPTFSVYITEILTAGSNVTFNWAAYSNMVSGKTTAITFANEEVMTSNQQYISLSDSLSSSYELTYSSETNSDGLYYATLTAKTTE